MFEVGPGDWVVAIGDVCGKGVDAAVVTAVARYTLRAAAVRVTSPAEALAILDDVLRRHETDRFCTVALLRLREHDGGWTATVSSGGHPRPLLLRPGAAPEWFGPEGSLIGVLDGAAFEDASTELRPGDALVLYTDGVTEARRDGEFYGEARLVDRAVRSAVAAATIAEELCTDVVDFQRGDARDDIAIVAVRVPAPEG
ncbi:MAG TPA: PP2C family protein-serine/threonine phosphatase [Mycobacteriales bacterium]|nr:PP2C family protein-serine/threonine phosphatase [Mycobacteriales bacterium]